MTNSKCKTTSVRTMSYGSLKKRGCGFAIFAFCCTALTFSPPIIPDANAAISKDKLRLIAKEFVKDVNKGFSIADNGVNSTTGQIQQTTTIPDGEELILKILVGTNKIPLNFDIIAIKEPNDILISLSDFFATSDLAISVNGDNGTATGWFIRENQEFFLDANKETVTIMGETLNLPTGSVKIKDGDIYATSYAISQWFNMRFIIDFKELAILLTTSQPLPAEERYARRKKKTSTNNVNKPKLPYQPQPYKMASVPSFDVNLRTSYSRFENSEPIKRQAWSVLGVGDLAYLNTRSFISGNDQDGINNARFTFSRESDNRDLLGPLKAKKYSFGDVYSTRLPLTGTSPQEQGVRITNTTDTNLSAFTTTDIRGDAEPDWDVELYRNDRFVDFQSIGTDGSYNFESIRLFAGENDFRLVFYGPQGEIQEKRENIPVNPNRINSGKSSYDISLTRNNRITYRQTEFDEPENDASHLVARYDRSFGKYGVIHAGIRNRQEEYDNKTYLETGIYTNIKDTLINANTAVDATNGGVAVELIGRRRIGKHSLRGSMKLNTKNFVPSNEVTDPITIANEINVTGPIKGIFGKRSTYGMNVDYWERANGSNNLNMATSIGTRFGNTILNNSMTYTRLKKDDGSKINVVENNINIRGFLKRIRWRLRGNYTIKPETELRNLFASISYPISTKVESFLQLERFFNTSRTEATASLNWKTEKAIVTPRISLDTDQTLRASVNARFGIGYEPQNSKLSFYNKSLSSSGGVSAKIFLDKNGDGVFSKDDELLPDIELDAVQSNRSATSNKDGIAFIPNIPKNRITDMQLDKGTFEDPFWLSSYKGLSLKPRPGIVTQIEFPIVIAGEIDGTLYLKDDNDNKTIARQYTLHLFTPDGRKVQNTLSAFDGFYIFSSIPPGTYFLTVSANDAKNTGYTLPPPKRIDIKPDGTTIYGEDIVLTRGNPIDYIFTSVNTPAIPKKSTFPAPKSYSAGVVLGQYKSRLAMTLAWYKLKIKNRDIGRYFEPVIALTDIQPDEKTQMYMLRLKVRTMPIIDIETAYMTCKRISEQKIPCSVEIISYYSEETASADNTQMIQ